MMYYVVIKIKPVNESPRILHFCNSEDAATEFIDGHLLYNCTMIATVDKTLVLSILGVNSLVDYDI